METNVSAEKALQFLLGNCPAGGQERVALPDSLGRVLDEDIRAGEDIPQFDRSPLDGYAFRAADTLRAGEDNPLILEVIEEVPAGYTPSKAVSAGKTIKVMTGAPIPEGADAVVKYEETLEKGNTVSLFQAFRSGQNIVRAGEDVMKGQIVARKGSVVNPPLIGLLAALGISEISVFRRPRVAVVSTGEELQDLGEELEKGKIRNSNSYSLAAYISELGGEPLVIGTAGDKAEEVAVLMKRGLAEADVVMTTGGVSVGDYDVVQDAVRLAGAEVLFWRIDMKPGSPTLAALKDGKLILGLSGNPAAGMVVFQLLASPLIKKLAGRAEYLWQRIEVLLKEDFRKNSPRRRYLRGRLVWEKGTALMEFTGGQGNDVLSSLIECDLLAEIPAGSGPLKAGEKLEALLLK
ncbi:molybdopterin molybdotransferase MoeA [Syntrophobotulus glycolicus]|nr:gephyrin-like molybdotransferase Glp [Syntrophobotulus glycolicus]